MTFNEIDNIINRINKKTDRIRSTLGEGSALYGRAVSIIAGNLYRLGLIKQDGLKFNIKRGNVIKNMTQAELDELGRTLNSIETALNLKTLSDEKKRLRGVIQTVKGKKNIGRVSYADYKKAEELSRGIGFTVNEAFDYFYNEVGDSEPEKVEAMKIGKITGRPKTFAELRRVIELAKQHMERTLKLSNPTRFAGMGKAYHMDDAQTDKYFKW